MAPKNFRAMAQTHIFGGFEPWLKPTFDKQILTSKWLSKLKKMGKFDLVGTLLWGYSEIWLSDGGLIKQD